MINLLPPIEKTKRRQEKILKLTWILGTLIIASTLSFSLILLSIRFYIANQAEAQKEIVEAERENSSQIRILQEKVESVNKTLSELNNFYQSQFKFSGFIEQISALLLPDMYLENFSYEKKDSRVVLSGYAPDIDTAYKFRERLRKQKDFKDINFTLPDWLQSNGTNFRVTFTLTFAEGSKK